MKTKLLSILMIVFDMIISISPMLASHLSGGEITSRNIGGLTYEVKLTLEPHICYPGNYTLQTGFNYSDSSGSWTVLQSGHYHGCDSLFNNNVGRYYFIDTITFPQTGFYNVYFYECCKAFAVINMSSVSLYVHNILLVDSTNSSPYFMNDPIFVAQLGDTFNYNPLGFDPDGDSLVYSVDTPLISLGIGDPGYYYPPSDPSMPFSINLQSGQMSWIPNTLGTFQMVTRIREYRNGTLIGSIERDIPLGVIPPTTVVVVGKDKIESDLIISPNPSNSSFTLTTNTPLTNPQIEICNMMGAIVYSEKINTTTTNFSKQINLNASAGIYFVKLSEGERQYTKKLVVE